MSSNLVSGGNVNVPTPDTGVVKFHFRGRRYGIMLSSFIPAAALIIMGIILTPGIINGQNKLAAQSDIMSTVYNAVPQVDGAIVKGVPLSKIMADKAKYITPKSAAEAVTIKAGSCGSSVKTAYTLYETNALGTKTYAYTSSTQWFHLVNGTTINDINKVACK